MSLAETCIPNKTVTIRPTDPPWITSHIKRLIRTRKRAYRKAKRTQDPSDWNKFKHFRNKITAAIRESKKALNDNLAEKLKSSDLSSKQWWSILKSFISPKSNSTIPPLEKDGTVYVTETEKANLLNDFFKDQTIVQQIPSLTWKWGSNFFSLLILVVYMFSLKNLADASLALLSILIKSRRRPKWQQNIELSQLIKRLIAFSVCFICKYLLKLHC